MTIELALEGVGKRILLVKRGYVNPERTPQNIDPAKGEKPYAESWPGVCTFPVHGRVEKGETAEQALMRETREELGAAAQEVIFVYAPSWAVREVSRVDKAGEIFAIFKVELPAELSHRLLEVIALPVSSGGIKLLDPADLPKILTKEEEMLDKWVGVTDPSKTVMYEDARSFLRLAFSSARAP